MTFDWHMLYPLHTIILDNSQVFGGVPCKAQLCNFSKLFFRPRFGVVPIWELWQFCYVRIGPPKLLSRCLHVLVRLTLGYEDKVEYVRTIVVARLLWCPLT